MLFFTSATGGNSELHFGYASGDYSGTMHVTTEVAVHIFDSISPFPVAFEIYKNTFIELPKGDYP